MNPRNDTRSKNSPNLVSIEEVRFLRSKVATLEKQLQGRATPAPATETAPTKTAVEYKVDPRVYGALRDLLVAAENHFGPEPGVKGPKPSKELATAMESAAKLVRKDKKP